MIECQCLKPSPDGVVCGRVVTVRGAYWLTERSKSCGKCSWKPKKVKAKAGWEIRGVRIWMGGEGVEEDAPRYESGELVPTAPADANEMWFTECMNCHRREWYKKATLLNGGRPVCVAVRAVPYAA